MEIYGKLKPDISDPPGTVLARKSVTCLRSPWVWERKDLHYIYPYKSVADPGSG